MTCQADSDIANLYLRKLTAGIKLVNERFKEILAPANETVKQIRDLRTQILTPLEDAKRDLTTRLMAWRREEQERIAEKTAKAEAKERERQELEEAHADNGRKPPGPPPVIEKPEPLAARDTTKTRKGYDYKIVDFSKIPDRFLKPNWQENAVDGRAIRSAAAADEEIPGIELIEKEIPVFA